MSSIAQNTALTRIAGPQIRKLARKGKLLDETFKVFQRAAFPDASSEQVHLMRTCFFAGAAEIHALTMYGLEDGSDPTLADYEFMENWVNEVERFHGRTIATMMAEDTKSN